MQLLMVFIKILAFLLGLALLVGGGGCVMSFSLSALTDATYRLFAVYGTLALIALPFIIRKINYLALVAGCIFLIGGGLCATYSHSDLQAAMGILLISYATALSGYLLIRWVLKKPS